MADPTPAAGGDLGALTQALKAIERRLEDLESPSGTQRFQSVKKLEETIERLEETITAMPVAVSGTATSTMFSMTGGWNNIAVVNISAPAGKTVAAVIAVASGQITAVLDGSSLATLNQRIVINGNPSPTVYPEYRAGENVLYHPIVAGFGANASGNITVQLQVLPGSTAAFPPRSDSNVSLAVIAIYNS